MLGKLENKDLLFLNMIENDRLNTCLILDDYDWMHYTLKANFHIRDKGKYFVEIEYFGASMCHMIVDIAGLNKYRYTFNVEIFIKHIKKYMTKHMKHWGTKFGFYGEELFLDFYNEIIEKGKLTEIRETTIKAFDYSNVEYE